MSKSFQDLLRVLETGATDVRSTGDELTRRIKAFETWLGKLPGRVPTSCHLYDFDPAGEIEKRLSLGKSGKSWSLFVFDYDNRCEESSEHVLLRDAPLSVKIAAMRKFPELLRAIADSQRSLIEDANKSISEFEIFAAQIGLKEEA